MIMGYVLMGRFLSRLAPPSQASDQSCEGSGGLTVRYRDYTRLLVVAVRSHSRSVVRSPASRCPIENQR